MGWLSFLSPKTVDNTVNNLMDKDTGLLTQFGNWVGGMNYTAEEQAEANKAMVDGAAKFVVDTLSENTVRSKTRRDIAVLWIKVQLTMIGVVFLVAPIDLDLAKFYAEITFGTLMISGTLSVLAFFFGGHYLRDFRSKGSKTKE